LEAATAPTAQRATDKNAATKNRAADEAAAKKEQLLMFVTAKNKTAANAGCATIKIFSYLPLAPTAATAQRAADNAATKNEKEQLLMFVLPRTRQQPM
jgi:hypothetical protein